jgi:hypothetical protein
MSRRSSNSSGPSPVPLPGSISWSPGKRSTRYGTPRSQPGWAWTPPGSPERSNRGSGGAP